MIGCVLYRCSVGGFDAAKICKQIKGSSSVVIVTIKHFVHGRLAKIVANIFAHRERSITKHKKGKGRVVVQTNIILQKSNS